MGASPSRHTYVDRGDLDARVRSTLASGAHIVMHGESKHGKSWLRASTLPESQIARVQCVPGMSVSSVIEQALGRLKAHEQLRVVVEDTSEMEGEESSRLALKVVEFGGRAKVRRGRRNAAEGQPVGQHRGDLGWVAEQFRNERRTPVFEDFHNLDSDVQRQMTYIIKALGEWQVPCVVSGIWTDTHLLKLHNGELDGRIEDLELRWTFEELTKVVRQGCAALNVETSDRLADGLVKDAYTSVGLLQELTRATLSAAGVTRRTWSTRKLDDLAALAVGRQHVVKGIAARFDPFIQLLPRAKPPGVEDGLYPALVRAVTQLASEQELLDGIAMPKLHLMMINVESQVTGDQVQAAAVSIEAAQRSVNIKPAVLAYDAARERLVLADRRLLLYLRERPPR
jgi:hypothetical protein